METPEERIRRVVREEVLIAPYDPRWPDSFRREKETGARTHHIHMVEGHFTEHYDADLRETVSLGK